MSLELIWKKWFEDHPGRPVVRELMHSPEAAERLAQCLQEYRHSCPLPHKKGGSDQMEFH